METSSFILLALIFFSIAAVYSSVGFGGGSSYIAILSLYFTQLSDIKTIALICNIIVVAGGCLQYFRKGLFEKRIVIPVALCSVPFAFAGSMLPIKNNVFFLCLGGVLTIAGILLMAEVLFSFSPQQEKKYPMRSLLFTGSGIGFLSGLTGIGGGILLSPVLHFFHWKTPQKIAALCSFFILVNSIAGLSGIAMKGDATTHWQLTGILALSVFLGGQAGTRISIRYLSQSFIKGLTGVLIFYIGIKIILKYAFQLNI